MAKDSKIMADTEANISHCEKVDNLTIGEIMGMDNNHDLFKGEADLIDNLRGYLLDNLAVRKHMNYDCSADEHTTKQSTYVLSVPASYVYEIKAKTEEEARQILMKDGGLDIDGTLCLESEDYKEATLVEQWEHEND